MRIAIVGYGKMGKAIEKIALKRGHSISHKITSQNIPDIVHILPENTDVAIEFTHPEAAYKNNTILMNNGVKTICGSTGWTDEIQDIYQLSKEHHTSFLWASNFSLGVNLFFELNQKLAALMNKHPEYNVSINEIHHTQKKDAPSGTAITLANQILALHDQYNNWQLATSEQQLEPQKIPIYAERIDPAPGTHAIKYHSNIDDIEIIHTAHSRDGFALGAVIAAEYVHEQAPGIYTMKDVLQLN